MPCKLDIAVQVKQDILDCNIAARRQIGDFLLTLQQNLLPKHRRPLSRTIDGSAFYVRLPWGFYVSWEIIGDSMHLALTGETEGILIRVLGVARALT
jgi:hypothetical protein